jgi:hypothetical protein
MATTLKVFVDSSAPGAEHLMVELSRQFRELNIGAVEEKREPPPPGTLAVVETALILLQLTTWSAKTGLAVWEIIQEVRKKHAAEKNIPTKMVPDVFVTKEEGGTTTTLKSSAKKEDVEAFLGDTYGKEKRDG